MEIRRMKVKELRPAEYNPRIELKPGDAEYEALKTSLETSGIVIPIVWNEDTGRVVGGHQRLKVIMELGIEETDVSVVHLDETRERQANIALNRIEGEFDDEKLHALFSEFNVEDILSTGFTAEEYSDIFPEGEAPDTDNIYDDSEEGEEDDDDPAGDFTVFLSFPSRADAEKWLSSEGIDRQYSKSRNLILRMEGENYGD